MMVVLMHSPVPSGQGSGIFLSTLSYLTMPCIGIFFAISGALLLPVSTPPHQSGKWLRKRLVKVIVPALFWTFFYLIISGKIWAASLCENLVTFFSIPFSVQGHGILWFMYTLVGLYVLAPVISPWLEKADEKALRYYLLLWLVTLCYPYLDKMLEVNNSTNGTLYYFSGYAGYFVLGYYLHRFGSGMKWRLVVPLYIIALLVPVVVTLLRLEVDFYEMFWYLSIFGPMMLLFWWKVGLQINSYMKESQKMTKAIAMVSNLSFGIYLVHIFVMRWGLDNWKLIQEIDNYSMQTFVIFILTMLISIVICYLIALMPIGNYVIGYKRKYVKKKLIAD